MSDESSNPREIVRLKIAAFREFFKRFYFESKYVNLCTLNEEYLSELLINLRTISNTQKRNLADIRELAKDEEITQRNRALEAIVEQNEEEIDADADISSRIAVIQDQLSLVENYQEQIFNSCIEAVKDAQFSVKYLRVENDELKERLEYYKQREQGFETREAFIQTDRESPKVEEIDIQVNLDQEKDLQYEEQRQFEAQRVSAIELKYQKMCENNDQLKQKLSEMSRSLEHSEKLRKELVNQKIEHDEAYLALKSEIKRMQERVVDCEEKLLKGEKHLRDRDFRVEALKLEVSKRESMINDLQKEVQTIETQKNTIDSRIKTANNIMKNHEKERERLNQIIQKRDQHISSLQKQLEHYENELTSERHAAKHQMNDIGMSLHELNELVRTKDAKLEELRAQNKQITVECQRLIGIITEKENELYETKLKLSENQIRAENAIRESDEHCQRKIEENFTSVVAYLEEKENEVARLRKELEEYDAQFNAEAQVERQKVKDLEDLLVLMTKELRAKEEEMFELRALLHNYKELGGELSYFREAIEHMY